LAAALDSSFAGISPEIVGFEFLQAADLSFTVFLNALSTEIPAVEDCSQGE
jgi:hypothetical protein